VPKSPAVVASLTISDLIPDWELSLQSDNKSEKTVYSYVLSAQLFEKFLAAKKLPTTVLDITPAHVQAFQVDTLRKNKPTTAMVRFKSLQQFWKWCVGAGEVVESPMGRNANGELKVKPPKVVDPRIDVVSDPNLKKLVKSCQGTDAEDRRDLAMVRMFLSTGCRLGELTNLTIEDIDQREREILVTGKGNRIRTVRYGVKAAEALNTHLRELKRRGIATGPVWIGRNGHGLTPSGMTQVLRRRCRAAGLPQLHWHQFRHTAADKWYSGEGSEGNAMKHFGWSTATMARRYGASNAEQRARQEATRLGIGDDV